MPASQWLLLQDYPDIYAYRRPFEADRTARTIESDGPPALIIEVLSESTYEVDLDLMAGKPYSYAHAGVMEYVTVNPSRAVCAGGDPGMAPCR